jgi:hypothetical protein
MSGPARGRLGRWPRPRLVRFMMLHGAIGFGIAAVFVGGILLADPGGLGRLLAPRGPEGVLPLALLWFFSGLTFGSVQIGAAVMMERNE